MSRRAAEYAAWLAVGMLFAFTITHGQRLSTLSERERQVLDGLVSGLPNKTIAYDLGISPRTVEIHRANVMSKMGAGSLSPLVRMALIMETKP